MDEEVVLQSAQEEMVQSAARIEQDKEIKLQEKRDELDLEHQILIAKWTSKKQSEEEKIRENSEREIERMVKRVSKEAERKLDIIRKSKERLSKIDKGKQLAKVGKAHARMKRQEILLRVRQALKNSGLERSDGDYVNQRTLDLLIPKMEMHS